MRKLFEELLILLLLAILCSCSRMGTVVRMAGIEFATDTVACQEVFRDCGGDELVVKEDIDLNGKRCSLPKGVTINFQGGVVKNGTLVGDETKIKYSGACFDRVRIQGTWHVSEISTSMFRDLDYDNSLKDVVALASPQIKNRIVIEDGDYQVTALGENHVCIPVCSNTELVINGTIYMTPNNYTICYVIQAGGDNIDITGKGTIIGDKHTHTGNAGEWGMGISLRMARNVLISGLTIKDCWGDCIYVDDESKNVVIENCQLDHGRRQGISVVFADSVTIRNCTITNVEGTEPEYAIDIEPDERKTVDHVIIERVTVKDCKGGFLVFGWARDARVGTVVFRDCRIEGKKKEPIAAGKCDTLIVDNSNIVMRNGWACVSCNEVGHLALTGNTIWYANGLFHHLKDWARPLFGKGRVKMMDIGLCGTKKMENNKYREL